PADGEDAAHRHRSRNRGRTGGRPMAITLDEPTRRILDGKNFATVATVNPDGGPQTSVVWYRRRGALLGHERQAEGTQPHERPPRRADGVRHRESVRVGGDPRHGRADRGHREPIAEAAVTPLSGRRPSCRPRWHGPPDRPCDPGEGPPLLRVRNPASSIASRSYDRGMPDRDRHVGLETCFNFRDLGGYETVEGRQVRWQAGYRSDSLHRLKGAAPEAGGGLGLRAVCHLRRTRALHPDRPLAPI